MSYEQFIEALWVCVYKCPKEWRKGQAVFNVVEQNWGVARDVQFQDGVDCFYDDSKIDQFIECAWERIKDEDN